MSFDGERWWREREVIRELEADNAAVHESFDTIIRVFVDGRVPTAPA
jgi:hypothetical protein